MMTELESLIVQECNKAHATPCFELRSPKILGGIPIKLKPIENSVYFSIVNSCTRPDGTQDAERLQAEVIAECMVEPQLMRGEFMEAVGAGDALGMVRKLFPKPGQVRVIRQKIEEISGFYDGEEAEFRECK